MHTGGHCALHFWVTGDKRRTVIVVIGWILLPGVQALWSVYQDVEGIMQLLVWIKVLKAGWRCLQHAFLSWSSARTLHAKVA